MGIINILILLGSGIGNIIQGTPCITALKRLGHTVSVAMWSSMPAAKQLLQNCDEIDKLFFYPNDRIIGSYDFIVETLHSRAHQFESNLQHKGKVLTTQFSRWGVKNDVEINLEAIEKHFGYNTKKLGIPKTFCSSKNHECDIVLINGSNSALRWLRKRYPHMKELVESMPDKKFICVGNKGEGITADNVVDLTGKLELNKVIELIKTAKLVIASDSGLSHVAGALGVPTIVLFGFTDPIKCKPLGDHIHIIRKDLPCSPCQYNQNTWVNCKDWKCIKEITPESIKDKALEILK